MNRLLRWLVTVASLTALGAVLGGVFGKALCELSYDYVVTPSEYANLGARTGLFVGAVLAAVQTVGRLPLPNRSRLFRSFALLSAVTLGVVALAGLLGPVLLSAGWLDTSGWVLPNPRRHALFLGLDRGARLGPLLGCAVAVLWLWRSRTRLRGE